VTTDAERIDALETHLAFQDDTIRQLSDALVAQQGRLDQMQAELTRLAATVRDETNDTRITPADEVPPHY
jgi:SlyX protein